VKRQATWRRWIWSAAVSVFALTALIALGSAPKLTPFVLASGIGLLLLKKGWSELAWVAMVLCIAGGLSAILVAWLQLVDREAMNWIVLVVALVTYALKLKRQSRKGSQSYSDQG